LPKPSLVQMSCLANKLGYSRVNQSSFQLRLYVGLLDLVSLLGYPLNNQC
jgi:hypothetical protein